MADHIVYRCVSMRYTDGVENVTAGSVVETASSDISIPGASSGGTRRVIIAASSGAIDSASFEGSSSWVSDDVDVTAEAFFVWCNTDTGHGGGISSGSGVLDGSGASGNWTSTWNAATKQANMSFACFGSDPVNLPQTYDTTTGAGVDDVAVSLPIFGGGFYLLLFAQTANEELETPTGWTLLGSIGTGTAGAVGSTRITIFGADADGSPPAPTLSIVSGAATNVDPSSIASVEAFGTATIAHEVEPGGIATGETFGTAVQGHVVAASSITTSETVGVAQVAQILGCSGIASGEAFGTLAMSQSIDAASVSSEGAMGGPALDNVLSPVAVGSLEAFGTAVASLVVLGSGVASAEAFGTAGLFQALGASGVASAEAFGAAVLDQRITAAGVAGAEVFGDVALALDFLIVQPSSVTSAETFGTPAISIGFVITSQGVISAETFGVLQYLGDPNFVGRDDTELVVAAVSSTIEVATATAVVGCDTQSAAIEVAE